jgi:deoxyribose-phosphate aldolase
MTATSVSSLSGVTASQATLRAFLHGLPGVDQVGADQRAAMLGTRSIKTDAKSWAIDLAIRMVDLTTLEGADTPGKVRALCAKARRPAPGDPTCPSVAAVCVYPAMVPVAASRGAFLAGRYAEVLDEVVAVKEACGEAHLKVILETGELVTYDNVRRASWLAMLGGADFIKTSTGKVPVAATPPVTLVMLEAVRDYLAETGRQVGVKPAGGIRTSKDAIKYLVLVNETAGERWLDPDWFRFGASTLLNDLLMQRAKMATGRYSGPDYVTLD